MLGEKEQYMYTETTCASHVSSPPTDLEIAII